MPIPPGLSNDDEAAGPGTGRPELPVPAKTLKVPLGVIFSIWLLDWSSRYRLPTVSTASLVTHPSGVCNAGPGVTGPKLVLPATTFSLPAGVILTTWSFSVGT